MCKDAILTVLYRQAVTGGRDDHDGEIYKNVVRVLLRKWTAPGNLPDRVIETLIRIDGESTVTTGLLQADWKDYQAQRYAIETFDILVWKHPTLGKGNDAPAT